MTAISFCEDLELWYSEPASKWTEALPVGNGRLGGMVYGGADTELIKLNEDTLCSGEPGTRSVDIDITERSEEVIGLIRRGCYAEAEDIIRENWLGRSQDCYQMLGELRVDFDGDEAVTGYKRSLDISNSIAKVEYSRGDVHYSREVFASNPADVIVVKLSASKKGALSFKAGFSSIHPTASQTADNSRQCLVINGRVPATAVRRDIEWIIEQSDQWKYPELFDEEGKLRAGAQNIMYSEEPDGSGTSFQARLAVETEGGKAEITDEFISVQDADEAVLIISADTSFNGFDKSPSKEGVNPEIKAKSDIAEARKKPYTRLKEEHIIDYKELFDRVSFELTSADKRQSRLTTDKRIAAFGNGNDQSLVALLFQYGRYLMISGSRAGTQALNLQGIWSNSVIPPWSGEYTININTEMNYWLAEVANLNECHQPLFSLIDELAVDGRKVACQMYGSRGWVAHHNTDHWRCAQPIDGEPLFSFWNMSSGWFCSHLWEHFLYTRDQEFLRKKAYPLMKEAAVFYIDWLMENDDGFLVTPVSTSPENRFYYQRDGEKKLASVSMGSTMDMAVIRGLFRSCIEAAKVLKTDADFQQELKDKLKKLLPYQISKDGGLQEWSEDFEQYEPQHRHFSHLYCLHPSNQISKKRTPELFDACRKSLELRGDKATGWSMGWKINAWARLKSGKKAYKILSNLFTLVSNDTEENYSGGGGLYANMFDAHPPFQIDGNFGAAAGIAEMIIQSHLGFIELLPALPREWKSGQLSGLRARGGFEIDIKWAGGELQEARIVSLSGRDCEVVYKDISKTFTGKNGSEFIFKPKGL